MVLPSWRSSWAGSRDCTSHLPPWSKATAIGSPPTVLVAAPFVPTPKPPQPVLKVPAFMSSALVTHRLAFLPALVGDQELPVANTATCPSSESATSIGPEAPPKVLEPVVVMPVLVPVAATVVEGCTTET